MSRVPEDIDLERTLLGTLMYWPEPTIKACWAAGLGKDDFSRPAHGVIYDAIGRSLRSGEDVDAVSVVTQLRREEVPAERGAAVNALEFVGGPAAVLSMEENHGETTVAKRYAEEIVSLALSREMMLTGDELIERARDLSPVAETVTTAERRLAAARDRADGRVGPAKQRDVADILQRVLTQYISSEPDDLLPFQLPTLNAIGGGMAPGDVIVVGARSGVGKTWWGLDAVEQTMSKGRRSVTFSLEMPQDQLVRRIIAMGGLNLTGIKKRALPYDSLIDRVGVIDGWRGLYDIEDGPTNVDRIQATLASARIAGNPYRVVVLDHLHLLDVPGSKSDYRIALNTELTRIKHMAGEHGCTIILLAQLNRPKKGDEAKRPTIHDLRESGGIGDIADYVLLLHREPGEDGHATNRGVVVVEKVRDGAGACDIDVVFDPRTYRFVEGYMAGTAIPRRAA